VIIEKGSGQWETDLPGLLTAHGYVQLCETRQNLVFERGPRI
jgi:hypothetical protein